ncbi:MAG TPA: hypothetical protein VER58_21610 [Thermoanaerobaculia bacterium]|nr:hypothetical protein [Thermoanaerobaculia bacterium]
MFIALLLLLEFGSPERVTIAGYSGDAMEPFLTRDGSILLFNNRNDPPSETDLHWAERIDDLTFAYRGKVQGANSPALDAVPTVDVNGNIYFVTTRSYDQTLMTIYRGHFDRGLVTDVAPVTGISRLTPGQVNFDVEVSADGNTLYFTDGLFTGGSVPAAADLAIATRGSDGQFHRVERLLNAVNTAALEYVACISADELELFFTRIVDGTPAIFRSTRGDRQSAWGVPQRIAAITGFAEAPTIAPGGRALYYHALRDGRFVIERVTRGASRHRAVGH